MLNFLRRLNERSKELHKPFTDVDDVIHKDPRNFGEQLTTHIESVLGIIHLWTTKLTIRNYRPYLQAADVLESRDAMRSRIFLRTLRYLLTYVAYALNKKSLLELRLTPYLFLITHLRKLNVFSSSQTRLFTYYNEFHKFDDNQRLKSFPFVDKKLRKAQFNVLLGQIVNKKESFNSLFRQEDMY